MIGIRPSHPAELHVDLNAFRSNVSAYRSKLPPWCDLCAMVKDNGYGMGAKAMARAAIAGGATWLGVSLAKAAVELRNSGISAEILNVGPAVYEEAAELARHNIVHTVGALGQINELEKVVAQTRRVLRVHLALDYDMKREGIPKDDAAIAARRLVCSPYLKLEGVWTHFALADDPSWDLRNGHKWFDGIISEIKGIVGPIRWRHSVGSSVISRMNCPINDNLARPGIGLYGVQSSELVPAIQGVHPVASLWSLVTHIRSVPQDAGVSYGHSWQAPRNSRVATLSIGYGDGLPRNLPENGAFVVIMGKPCFMVGRITLGSLMVELPEGLEPSIDEPACIFGGTGALSLLEIATLAKTNPHDILVKLSSRVVRCYS